MKRIPYNLGHYSFQLGVMGHLQTLSIIPVLAGDSVTINVNSIMRLSPLRRHLLVDAKVDYFGFYVPHRHSYGSTWVDMIKDGANSATILPEVDPSTGGVHYLATQMRPGYGTWPQWMFSGYNQIWNRYFRFLQLTPEVPDTYNGNGTPSGHTVGNSPLIGSVAQRKFGFNCARVKTPWTTGIVPSIIAADKEVASATVLNIIDLAKAKMSYKTKEEREWFAQRYNDVLKNTFGSGVNIDADERPELLFRKTMPINARDIDGTDDATLGTYSSKSLTGHRFNIRRKFMPEHGAIFILALVRFPTIGFQEILPISRLVQDYAVMSGDFDLASVEEPEIVDMDKWLGDGSVTDPGTIPAGSHWRHQNNSVHFDYQALLGFPFLDDNELDTHVKLVYTGSNDYAGVFQTTQLGQWQCQSAISVEALRHFPTAKKSIYAGIN